MSGSRLTNVKLSSTMLNKNSARMSRVKRASLTKPQRAGAEIAGAAYRGGVK